MAQHSPKPGATGTAIEQVISVEEIAAEHRKAQTAFGEAVRHALRCGELLAAAKARLGHGEWLPWLERNFDFTRQTASAYMRLAANRAQVEMESTPSISAALKQLAAPKASAEPSKQPEEPAPTTPYVADTERKRQLAEKAKERLVKVAANPASFDEVCGGEAAATVLRLDRALAVTTDDEIDAAIADLDRGIRRYKELRDELRRRRS